VGMEQGAAAAPRVEPAIDPGAGAGAGAGLPPALYLASASSGTETDDNGDSDGDGERDVKEAGLTSPWAPIVAPKVGPGIQGLGLAALGFGSEA
jgi:hypothetical protein